MRSNLLSCRLIGVSSLAVAAAFAATPASALVINPTYVGMSAAAQTDLNSLISFYESTFTDTMTVNITFNDMSSGLGQSQTQFGAVTYAQYHTALIADASTTDDVTALAQLTAAPLNDASTIILSEANAKALGFDTSGFTGPDSVIGLNTSICFTSHNSPVSGRYDLYAVGAHELDEALGTVSGVGGQNRLATDIFRYDGAGARSFTTNTGLHAYFSIDGTNLLDEYNQFGRGGGDWGDWIVHATPQVQDYAGTPGQTINPNVELRLLDVVGYNRAPVPEPASLTAIGIGLLAIVRRRRSK